MGRRCIDEELGVVARESIFIYSANFIASVAGFLYWVIAAKLVPSNVLGTATTIISLTSITITLSTLGLGTAILRVGSIHRNEIGRVAYTALVLDLAATVVVIMMYLLLVYLVHIALRLLKKTELTLLLGIFKSITRVKVGG